jgi:tRNA1(Val) A37 N6-methylase TrmN6
MMNPPHMEAARTQASPNPAKAAARVEEEATLADWIGFALRMVRPRGTITMIHRADRLDEMLALLRAGAGEIVVFPLWPGGGQAAKRVIVRARKGVQTPLRLSAGMALHGEGGKYTPEADAVLRGAPLNIMLPA